MKRFALAGLLIALAVPAFAGSKVTMDGPMTDSNASLGQAYNRNFALNLDDHGVNAVAAQVVFSSGTYSAKTFGDGTASSGTITVVTATALSTAAATGKFTAVSTSVAVGVQGSATVVVALKNAGNRIRIVGPPGSNDYVIGANVATVDTATGTAANLVAAINVSSNTSLVTAAVNASSTVVTITCVNAGSFCNAYSVTSTSATAISTAAFASGANPVAVTIGGYVYRAVADFAVGASTAEMMNNLSVLVNASSTTTTIISSAALACTNATSCGIMYTTSTVTGSAANATTLASSNNLAISTASTLMGGGQDNAQVCINGTCLIANTHWYPKASAAATADSLYSAINSSFTIVVATDTGASGVVYATSTAVGTGTTYALYSSTQTALKIGGLAPTVASNGSATGAMIGGTAASYALSGQTLSIASHGFPVGLKVSISSTTGNAALSYSTATTGGTSTTLAFGTTMYVIPVNTSSIQLSLTSTGAVAGTAVTWVSSKTLTTADVWTVNVATAAGASSYGWYESNDGTNFWQVPGTSTTTIAGGDSFVYPSTFTFVDFGTINAKWLQLNVAAPATAGAISIKANIHGEQR